MPMSTCGIHMSDRRYHIRVIDRASTEYSIASSMASSSLLVTGARARPQAATHSARLCHTPPSVSSTRGGADHSTRTSSGRSPRPADPRPRALSARNHPTPLVDSTRGACRIAPMPDTLYSEPCPRAGNWLPRCGSLRRLNQRRKVARLRSHRTPLGMGAWSWSWNAVYGNHHPLPHGAMRQRALIVLCNVLLADRQAHGATSQCSRPLAQKGSPAMHMHITLLPPPPFRSLGRSVHCAFYRQSRHRRSASLDR
jgi:hypothetical protein